MKIYYYFILGILLSCTPDKSNNDLIMSIYYWDSAVPLGNIIKYKSLTMDTIVYTAKNKFYKIKKTLIYKINDYLNNYKFENSGIDTVKFNNTFLVINHNNNDFIDTNQCFNFIKYSELYDEDYIIYSNKYGIVASTVHGFKYRKIGDSPFYCSVLNKKINIYSNGKTDTLYFDKKVPVLFYVFWLGNTCILI